MSQRNSVFHRDPPSYTSEKRASLVSIFKKSLIYMLNQYYLQEQFNLREKKITASVSFK